MSPIFQSSEHFQRGLHWPCFQRLWLGPTSPFHGSETAYADASCSTHLTSTKCKHMFFKNLLFLRHPPNFMLLCSLSLKNKYSLLFLVFGSFVSQGFIAFRDKLFFPALGSWDRDCCHIDSYSPWRMSHSQVSSLSVKPTPGLDICGSLTSSTTFTHACLTFNLCCPLSLQISRCWNSTIFLRSSSNILSKRPSSEPQTFIAHHLHTLAHAP